MDFPQQTKDLVGKLAAEFRGKSPLSELVAQSVYHYLHGRFSYGFGEGLKQGYFIRWPHEIEREWECIEAATFTYALAEAAGLQPRMLSVKRWNGLDTGHETVDVLVDGKRVLIDPLNSMFGAASYDSQGIAVQDNPHTGRCVLPCTQPEEVPRQRAINRIDYYRSDEGIINLLRAGQSYQVGATQRVFISYDPKLRVFEQQMRTSMPFLDPLYYSERRFLGGNRTEYEVGTYDGADWLCLEGKEQFWRVTEEHLPFTVAVKFGAEPGISTQPSKTQARHEYFALTKRGQAYWLLEAAYEALLREKYPELHDDPRGPPGNRYLFDNRETPLEALAARICKLESEGITPAKKGIYTDVKHAYFSAVHLCQECDMERVLDMATLKLRAEELGRESGTHPAALYVRVLRRLFAPKQVEEPAVTVRRYIDAHKYHFWYPNPDNWRKDVFHGDLWEQLFARLEKKELLFEPRSRAMQRGNV